MITDLIYKLGHHGWGEITLVTDQGPFDIRISYITEPLVSLFDAITEMWSGELESDAFFDGEGPIYHLRLVHEWTEIVRVEFYENVAIDYYDFDFPGEEIPDPQYACSMPLSELAFMVARQAENLLKEVGVDKYEERWIHPFPLEQYKAYVALIGYQSTNA